MAINKNQILEIMARTLNDLPLQTDDLDTMSDEDVALVERALLNAMPEIIGMALIAPDRVICQLPYNAEVIPTYASVQCPMCERYFCRRHKLFSCPRCGGRL